MRLFDNLQKRLEPLTARRQELEKHPDEVRDILNDGAKRAQAVAAETMAEVRKAVKI
jgi:tryptophanyl-tRNA synthetase